MREVKVTVNPDGTTKTDWSGFVGTACLDEAARLRQLLLERYGIQVAETNFVAKPELSSQAEQGQSIQRQQAQGGQA